MFEDINLLQTGIGFTVGVLAKFVGSGALHYTKSTLIPYVADNAYKHIDLSDSDWRIVNAGEPINGEDLESEWEATMNLTQVGDRLIGKATTKCTKGSKKGTTRQFDIAGTVTNGVVLLSMLNSVRSIKSQSAFLLQVVGDGKVLEGYRLFYGMNKNEINGTRCNLLRGDGKPISDCGSG